MYFSGNLTAMSGFKNVLVVPVTRLIQLFERNQAATSRDCPRVHNEHPGRRPALSGVHRRHHPDTERPQQVSA